MCTEPNVRSFGWITVLALLCGAPAMAADSPEAAIADLEGTGAVVTRSTHGLGAFVTALHAPRHGLILAISMAPLTALLATVSNLLLQLTGTHVDLSGFHGNLGMFAVSLAYGVFTSAVGGGIGLWVVRRRTAPAAAIATPVTPALDPPPPT